MIVRVSTPAEVDVLLKKLEEQGYVWKNLKKRPMEMAEDVKSYLKEGDLYINIYEEPDYREKRWVKLIAWGRQWDVKEYLDFIASK